MASVQALACVLLLLWVTDTLAAPTISLPLTHRQHGLPRSHSTQLAHLQAKLQSAKVAWKANKNTPLSTHETPPLRKRADASTGRTELIEFFDHDVDIAYYVAVSVGTPAQQFHVVADTGSSDFWLAAPGSNGINETFAPASSSTYKPTTIHNKIGYNTGNFNGLVGFDTVTLAGLTSPSSTLSSGVVNDPAFSNRFLSGIMGFGWPSLSRSGRPTFMADLIAQGALAAPILSMHLGRGVDTLVPSANGNDGIVAQSGSLTLGGTDPSTYTGPISYFPIVEKAHWVVQSAGIVVDGKIVRGTADVQIMMDTGTSLLAMPSAMLQALAAAMGATIDRASGAVSVDCSNGTLPSISFRLGGANFAIAPEDLVEGVMIVNTSTNGQYALRCMLPFTGGQEESERGQHKPMIIAGDVFLKSWTSVYDMGQARVGLARANPPSQFSSTGAAINARLALAGGKPVNFTDPRASASVSLQPSGGASSGGVSRARVSAAALASVLYIYVIYYCW